MSKSIATIERGTATVNVYRVILQPEGEVGYETTSRAAAEGFARRYNSLMSDIASEEPAEHHESNVR